MNLIRLILTIAILTLLSGCDDDNVTRAQVNAQNLAGGGTLVGILPDGREVRCYRIKQSNYDHYIYVAGSDITVNREVKSGKTHHNETQAFLVSPTR